MDNLCLFVYPFVHPYLKVCIFDTSTNSFKPVNNLKRKGMREILYF